MTSLSLARSGSAVPRRLPGIDLLRALAAIVVAIAHVVETALPHRSAAGPLTWTTLGAWGVGLFFVLSGLCIHLPVARAEANGLPARVEPGAFFRRRFLRLYPAHLVALILSAALAALLTLDKARFASLLSVPDTTQLGLHVLMLHTFVPSAVFSVNGVLWTLALETHFYLAYPLFLRLRRRVGTPPILAGFFALSAALFVAHRLLGLGVVGDVLVGSALCRGWEWLLGCWIAERLFTRRFAPIGAALPIALAAGSLVLGRALLAIPGGSSARAFLWPILFAVVVTYAVRITPDTSSLPRRVITRIGEASYSLYLVHPIALHVALFLVGARAASEGEIVALAALAIAVATIAFYAGVERPFLTRSLGVRPARIDAPQPEGG